MSDYQHERFYPFHHYSAFNLLLFVGVAGWYYNKYKYPNPFINIEIIDRAEPPSIAPSDFSLSDSHWWVRHCNSNICFVMHRWWHQQVRRCSLRSTGNGSLCQEFYKRRGVWQSSSIPILSMPCLNLDVHQCRTLLFLQWDRSLPIHILRHTYSEMEIHPILHLRRHLSYTLSFNC